VFPLRLPPIPIRLPALEDLAQRFEAGALRLAYGAGFRDGLTLALLGLVLVVLLLDRRKR
jgi:hypothetical protein